MKPIALRLRPLLLLAGTVLPGPVAAAGPDLPVLRSRSKTVTVVDGGHVKRHFWTLVPEKNPDVYYVEIPRKAHSATFRSDVDSVTFPVRYGDRHDFVILLNDKVACRTQIRAAYRKPQPFSRTGPGPAARDVIPFRLGDDDKIYIKGRLNNGKTLNFQFDLGCGGGVIKKGSVLKARMRIDGTADLVNGGGRDVVPSSSTNRLQVGHLRWDGLPFAVGDNMTHREDGLLGNTLFQDKVVEINYDRRELTVHDALPPVDPAYSKHEIVLDGVVPSVRGTLTVAGTRREGWLMFDTCAYTSILYSDSASPTDKLLFELRALLGGDPSPSAPRLTVGGHAFAGFNYGVQRRGGDDDRLGLLGNDILKRFNVILDNRDGYIYLRPNALAGAPFANPEYYLARAVVAAGFVAAVAGGWWAQRAVHQRICKNKTKAVG